MTTTFAPDDMTVRELLSAYAAIIDSLRRRDIVRSINNPLGDYAEALFCRAFGWTREPKNSAASIDATGSDGSRYQVKGRRLTKLNGSRQLSDIRTKRDGVMGFDHLGGLLVDESFVIIRAALIPVSVVQQRATHRSHTNSWRFLLLDAVWNIPGVRDVTDELRAAAVAI